MSGQNNFSHDMCKNDPILFTNYVGKKVKIMMKNKDIYCGIIYTVDPISASIVLLKHNESEKSTKHHLKIIFGHAINNIEVISEMETVIPDLFLSSVTKPSHATISNRKNTIIKLLLDNRFPIKEDGDIIRIEDTVSIEPPYYPENCTCTNSIIFSRIHSILTRVDSV